MQASLFYTSELSQSTAVVLLTPEQVSSAFDGVCPAHIEDLQAHQFKGHCGDVVFVPARGDVVATVYVGSQKEALDAKAMALAVLKLPAGTYHTTQPWSETALLNWSLAQYGFDQYKQKSSAIRVLFLPDSQRAPLLAQAQAVFLARDLINRPPNDLGPVELSDVLEQLAQRHGAAFQSWVGDDLLQEGFPAIHAVGRAAMQAPRLLSLTWGDRAHPGVTLVGKGVTFDSGGLDIKPASAMRLMKKDMGGAGIVIGLADWIMSSGVPIYLNVLIPAVENAVSADAYRPGDVLRMRNGLTVEIDNTDAEGRLILADALSYACEQNPDLIIDFATLTGAARVAVGTEISAVFSPDASLAQAMVASGEKMKDPVWHMPLYAGYESLYSSSIADLMNSSPSPYAGAIIAALFLQHFVSLSIPWIHFDTMAWNVSSKPGKPEGGEAMGLLAAAEYIRHRYL